MRHKLIEQETGAEVKPGMRVLDFRNEIFEVVGFSVPRREGSTGRVQVKKPGQLVAIGHEQEFYPSVFGLKVVEIKD
jgi:hypothetical protein